MATTEALDKIAVNVKLNNGTSQGVVKTVNVGLGTISTTGYDAQKAMNVVNALGDCLSKPVYTIQAQKTYTLTEE